jgi:predicted MFS family arabinose efflux permease
VSAPGWIRRLDWRPFTAVAFILVASSLVLAVFVRSFSGALVALAACGFFVGAMQATLVTGLGDSNDPQSAYSWSLAGQMLLQSIMALVASSYVLPRWGVGGLLWSTAALFLACAPLCALMPHGAPTEPAFDRHRGTAPIVVRDLVAPLLGLAATATFMAGIFSIWYLLENIGHAAGVSLDAVGWAVALSGIATVVTAGGIAMAGRRLPTMAGVAIGVGITILGVATLWIGSGPLFVLAVCGLSCGWGIGQPYLWGLTTDIDRTRRLFSASPAALGLGGALGTAIGGECANRWGLPSLVLFAVASIAATLPLALAARAVGRNLADAHIEGHDT